MPATPLHPLEPDMRAIRAFERLESHDAVQEARAALALYEDASWRAAMIPLTARTRAAFEAADREAASCLAAYARGEVPPAAFWQGFGQVVESLDQLLGEAIAVASRHAEALAELQSLRERAAAAGLPDEVRATVRTVLGLLAAEIEALMDGKLVPEDFERVQAQSRAVVEDALALAAPEPGADAWPVGLARRLASLDARARDVELPPFVARTVAELRAAIAALALDPGEDPAALGASFDALAAQLDACLAFGSEVQREEAEALKRFQALERRVRATPLAPLLAAPAEDLLEVLRGLLHRLEAGLYPLASFHHDFEREAERLELLVGWQHLLEDLDATR